MRKFNKGLLLSWLLTCSSFNAFAHPHIEWAKYQLPPVFISQGEYQDQGVGDAIFSFLQANLKDYSHSTYTSSGVRIMRDFRQKKLVCSAMTTKQGREDFMLFSQPLTILPSHNLHYSPDNPKLKPILSAARVEGILSLERLLASSDKLIVGLNTHRSFGDKINNILASYSQQVEHLDETTSTAGLLKMLDSRRIDLTIELPFISYFIIRSEHISTAINIEPLTETSTFVKAYIACSNNDAGQEAISAINRIVKRHRDTMAYQKMYENWIPQKSLDSFRMGFNRIVRHGE